MARVIPLNLEYQPNDTSALNWDEAPPAPAHYRCLFDMNAPGWGKSYGGLVWAPQLRDKLFEKFGNFGTFRTPVLLDEIGFRKLLRDYADGKYDRQSFVTTKLPKNYVPFGYYDKPLLWAEKQFDKRQARRKRALRRRSHQTEEQNANSKRSHELEG